MFRALLLPLTLASRTRVTSMGAERFRPIGATTWLLLVCLLISSLAGCGRGQTPIPDGAHEVHVQVIESEVRLDPATVPAGDVYVVLDTPRSGVGFAQRKATAAETPGPLREEDIERLARGDTEGTAIGGFDLFGCSDEQRAEDRGQMGPCGNVFKIVLTPGKYAFYSGNLEGGASGEGPRSIVILEVAP
jgi:hypothetical protein